MKKLIAAALLVCATARADDVTMVAPPGDESGRVDKPPSEDTMGRKVMRVGLFVPRAVIGIVMAPIRLGVYLSDRYRIPERARRLFFNDAGTFGIYPTLRYDSNYGLRIGAQLLYKMTPDDSIHAFAGGSIDGSVKRLDANYTHFSIDNDITVGGVYEDLPNRRFYAIGNVDSGAVEVRSQMLRAAARGGMHLEGNFQLRGAASIARRDSMETYDVGYLEAETLWDTRESDLGWDTPGVHSHGSLVSIWGGHATILDGRDFWRFGTDLLHYFRIGRGPRVIVLRFHGEAIDALATEVPMTELPSLGGPLYLRGYPIDRFRDRVAAVATAEYQWDLSHALFASLFVDTGRVYSGIDDLSLDNLRTGFGAALEVHALGMRGIRGSVASSTDGGVEFNFYLEPVFDLPPRVERR